MKLTENEKSLIYHTIRLAKDPANQIIMEAELNGCSIEDVKQILVERGEDVSKYETKSKASSDSFKNNTKKTALARKMYDKGAHDSEIAKKLEVSLTTIANWRRDNDLPSNNPHRQRKKSQEKRKLILDLHKQDYTNKQIAEIVGYKIGSVNNVIAELKKAAQLAL